MLNTIYRKNEYNKKFFNDFKVFSSCYFFDNSSPNSQARHPKIFLLITPLPAIHSVPGGFAVNGSLHPGRLTWNIQITHLGMKMIWTKPPWGHVPAVNLPGCTSPETDGSLWCTHLPWPIRSEAIHQTSIDRIPRQIPGSIEKLLEKNVGFIPKVF